MSDDLEKRLRDDELWEKYLSRQDAQKCRIEAADALARLRSENDRLRQERYDALSVTSKDGLLASEWVARTGKAEREAKALRSENEVLTGKLVHANRDAARWRYWRNYWPALCRFEVARFAQIDLTRVHVDSPALMDQVTDEAIRRGKP